MFGASRQKLTLAACCAAHAGQDGLTATTYVLLPVLAQSLGLGYGQVGILRAAQTTAMWLLELPAGVLAERYGASRLLLFGLVCAGLGYASLAFATGFYGVVAALFVAGCGAAFQHSLSSSLVSHAYRGPSRRTALGTYNASGDVGKLLFTALFGVLAGAGIKWQGVALGYGGVVLSLGIILFFMLRTARKAAEDIESNDQTASDAVKTGGWGYVIVPLLSLSPLSFVPILWCRMHFSYLFLL